MAKLTKKAKRLLQKIEKNKLFSLDAAALIKSYSFCKIDESVDIAVRVIQEKRIKWLGGVVTLPWYW
jgi:ribosomal protein L1